MTKTTQTTRFLPGMNTLATVRHALRRSGYSPKGILTATFVRLTNGGDPFSTSVAAEVHAITYRDDDADGGVSEGKVYVELSTGRGEW